MEIFLEEVTRKNNKEVKILTEKLGSNQSFAKETPNEKEINDMHSFIENNFDKIFLPYSKKENLEGEEYLVFHEILNIDFIAFNRNGTVFVIEAKLENNPENRERVFTQIVDYTSRSNEILNAIDKEEFKKSYIEKFKDKKFDDFFKKVQKNINEFYVNTFIITEKAEDDLIKIANKWFYGPEKEKCQVTIIELNRFKIDDKNICGIRYFNDYGFALFNVSSGTRRGEWDKKSFFEDAKNKLNEGEFKAVTTLYNFSDENADIISWGTGSDNGSFNPKFSKISKKKSPYTVSSDGKLAINFGWLHENEIVEKFRDNFKKELEKIIELKIKKDYKEEYPEVPIQEWASKVNDFIKIFDQIINKY